MPMFDILMTRDVTESCSVVVEAVCPKEALAHARQRAQDDTDLVWVLDDTPAEPDIYPTNIEDLEDA